MAKSSNKASAGPARFRLVILEAESPDGDLTQVMQAAQNALRPAESVPVVRRAIAAPPKPSAETVDLTPDDETAEVEPTQEANGAAPARTRRASKVRSPKVIELDLLSGEMPFADYAAKTKPESHPLKNLVVAAWFKKYRKTDEITMDHVYNCYRTVGWPTGMEDFGKTLRDLKGRKLMDGKGKGFYAINHVGLNEVTKIGG